MTGTAASLSNYDEVLKTYYLPGIQDYLNHSTILADIIETNEEDVSGKDATIEMHYGRSTGTGSRGDGGALPSANYQKYKTATVPMKYDYGRIEVNGPAIAATRNDRGAYTSVLDSEIMGILKDMKVECNRKMFGLGYGILARWRSGTSTSIVLDKAYRGNTNGDGFGCTFGGKYLDKRTDGVLIEVASLSSSTSATYTVGSTNIAVSALSKAATADTITVTDPGTPSAGDWFARPANIAVPAASGGHRYEMMGLRGLVNDLNPDDSAMFDSSSSEKGIGTTIVTAGDPLQGVDVSTYPWFVSIVDTHASGRYAGQRSLTLELMQTMFDMVEEAAGENYGPNLIMTTRSIRREYLKLVQADRITVNSMELDGGWSALDYNGVPIVVDNDAIDGEMYFLTTKDLQIYRMSDYEWMQKDGAILSRISGYDVYEAVVYRYAEFGITDRSTQGVLCDLSYTKGTNEGYNR